MRKKVISRIISNKIHHLQLTKFCLKLKTDESQVTLINKLNSKRIRKWDNLSDFFHFSTCRVAQASNYRVRVFTNAVINKTESMLIITS